MRPTLFNPMFQSLLRSVSIMKSGLEIHWLRSLVRKQELSNQELPVVSAPQQPEAEEVIRARAAECGSPVQFVNETYHGSPVALRGEYQKQNAAVAIAAIQAANIQLDEKAIVRGLAAIEWPARFQKWDERTIIDGAHNPGAARILAQTWREIFGDQKATLVLAVLSDKDLRGICEALAPIAESVLLPKIRSERGRRTGGISENLVRTLAPSLPYSITSTDWRRADACTREAKSDPDHRLTPFRRRSSRLFTGEPAAFEECAQ